MDKTLRSLLDQIRQASPPTTEASHADTSHADASQTDALNLLHDRQRAQAIAHLIAEIQRLPGLLKIDHQDYWDALDLTWEWLERQIHTFEERPPSLEISLVRWVNTHIKWRLRDVYKRREYQRRWLSLNASITQQGQTLKLFDLLSDTGFSPPLPSGLDHYILQQHTEQVQAYACHLKHYIDQDPDGILRQYCLSKEPRCNYQLLLQRLYLQNPPDKISEIAREFNVPLPSLYSLHDRKWKPVQSHLQRVLLAQGFQPE
jgi:hypothetical protein